MTRLPESVLTALPVYNEAEHVSGVLEEVARHSANVLVVDDGSTDDTSRILASLPNIQVVRHTHNRGYGAALKSAFEYAIDRKYDILVTIDCDGQHEPIRIPRFATACRHADIVSGSRYLKCYPNDSQPPEQRRRINGQITAELNRRLGLHLTDAFCGFKAYRVEALARINLNETGYAMPLELWVQAAAQKLRVIELPVPLIYLDEQRSFGGALDDAGTRLAYYRQVLNRALSAVDIPLAAHYPDRLCGGVAG